MAMVKAAIIIIFVIPIIALTAFGTISAIIMSDNEKRKEEANG